MSLVSLANNNLSKEHPCGTWFEDVEQIVRCRMLSQRFGHPFDDSTLLLFVPFCRLIGELLSSTHSSSVSGFTLFACGHY